MIKIVDCSRHLERGGKKDALYISSLFHPHIDKIKAENPHSVDMGILMEQVTCKTLV
jgi:hypothetical protein